MPDTGLADLENLLAAAAPASASAEVQAKGRKFGQLLFTTAAEAWGSFLGKRLFCEQGETSCQRPADALAEMPPQVIVTRFQISGKAGSDHYLVLPALLAKDLVAHFLALASGEEAKPETQRLDDEAMEAYRELVNILAGQATVALTKEFGEEIALSQVESRLVDFTSSPPALEFGKQERICHAAKITVEGSVPMPCLFLLPLPTAAADIAKAPTGAVQGETATSPPPPNIEIIKQISVPIVVVLAAKRERMENILAWRPGAIIEFRKRANELLDVCVNKIKIAEGEVVVINEHFGIQIRKLIDPRRAFTRFH